MKYPMAGDLQRKTATEISANPEENPYEVRSESGLEGVFADPDDAEFYAQEIREAGARGVSVRKRVRGISHDEATANPPRRFREGTRVIFRPTAVSLAMYSSAPPPGAVGAVTTVALPGGRRTFLPGPGGGLVYVDWDLYPVQGVSPNDLEVDRVLERAKRIAQPSKFGRRNPEDTFDSDILTGMEGAIWVTSWADWVEELSKEERKELDIPSFSGREISDVAPDAPASALLAAEDLYLLIERANGKTPGELFEKACEVDGCKCSEKNAELFGHYLAMQAMGHGVSWFDDHKQFPLKFPRGFEAHYADGELWWSPQVKSRQNPRLGGRR